MSQKLTIEQVRDLKIQLQARGRRLNCNALARKYGVSGSTITDLRDGLIWRHIVCDGEYAPLSAPGS